MSVYEGDHSSCCLELNLKDAFRGLSGWYDGALQSVPNSKPDAMFPYLFRQFAVLEESKVLFSDAAR